MKIWLILGNLWNSFRPCRGLIFLNTIRVVGFIIANVSVPCRGLIFLNDQILCNIDLVTGFRPLSGTYISQWQSITDKLLWRSFPTPVGDLYFSIVVREAKKQTQKCVSVPCRGLIFLNESPAIVSLKNIPFPSPVGDLYFSIMLPYSFQFFLRCFRPLSGTYISQLESEYQTQIQDRGFRPLSGTYISQYKRRYSNVYRFRVSVPCRGLIFLNV